MGVDLSLILPNDCHNIYDNALALEIFNKTIAQIKAYFGGREGFIDEIRIYNSDAPDWMKYRSKDWEPEDEDSDIDDECVEYSFRLPIIDATCTSNKDIGIYGLCLDTLLTSILIQKISMGISTHGQEKMSSISQEYLVFLRVGFVMNSIHGTHGLTKIELQVFKNGVPMVRIKKMPKCTNST